MVSRKAHESTAVRPKPDLRMVIAARHRGYVSYCVRSEYRQIERPVHPRVLVPSLAFAGCGDRDAMDLVDHQPVPPLVTAAAPGRVVGAMCCRSGKRSDVPDPNGLSAPDWARRNNHPEIVPSVSAGRAPYPNFHPPRRAADQRPATP